MRLDRDLHLIGQLIQVLFDAENQLVLALPRVAMRAANHGLRTALNHHREETTAHALRLQDVAEALDMPCAGRKSLAMQGLMREAEESMGYGGRDVLTDAALITSCQAVEHYEIAHYSALRGLCERFGLADAAGLLKETLIEEETAARTLSQLLGSLRMDPDIRRGTHAGGYGLQASRSV